MKLLAIETSCDETGVCLIEATGTHADFQYQVLGNALLSQTATHAPYGGVFPALAKREHARNLVPLFSSVLSQAHLLVAAEKPEISGEKIAHLQTLLQREPELAVQLMVFLAQTKRPNIDAIAVTHGPGLEPALWVGVNFARALSYVWDLPLVATNHMEGHVVMSAATETSLHPVAFPALALLISGGHTELLLMKEWFHYELVGQTRDDAVGEAFDKVARLMDLPYPGGPQISALAAEARKSNERLTKSFMLPRPMMHTDDFDFSFSGLKTAVRVRLEKEGSLTDEQKMQMAREFEEAATDVIVKKTLAAAEAHNVRTVIVGGGVSANRYIKERLGPAVTDLLPDTTFLVPPPAFATDNALMIALAGYFRAQHGDYTNPNTLAAKGTLSLST
jgi:N6-L-threonylcarbamoyladenine synthase